jgi:hypothetical protein
LVCVVRATKSTPSVLASMCAMALVMRLGLGKPEGITYGTTPPGQR